MQYIVSKTYKPFLVRYLSRSRAYSWKGIGLQIAPGVFHPGFFFSTKLLLNRIRKMDLGNKSVLELGAGSGLLSIYAARKNARVVATDISHAALTCLAANRDANRVSFDIFHSDLFDNIPEEPFDIILINPPYYKKKPVTDEEYAWYCGEEGDYFRKLFRQLSRYIHPRTETLMVLCDGCDIAQIQQLAIENGFCLDCLLKVNKVIEHNYIFRVERAADPAPGHAQTFQEVYLALRENEKRIYSDEELRQLPERIPGCAHHGEWERRKRSADRLIKRLRRKARPLKILEIGCGNGWLSHRLAVALQAEVTGTDINFPELEQARRVLGHLPNIDFIAGDAGIISFPGKFDVIVFAASIQYFSSLPGILRRTLGLLNAGGEIHILDSKFYPNEQIGAARQRSEDYFRRLGFGEMNGFYHHHSMSALREFDCEILYRPGTLLNRLTGNDHPFPWLLIKSRA